MTEPAKCELCGEPMPEGEEMFNYHGLSGPCPKPPSKQGTERRESEIRWRVARLPNRPSMTYRNDVEFLLKEIERLRAGVAPSRSPAPQAAISQQTFDALWKFLVATKDDYNEMKGSESLDIPVEFMELHEAASTDFAQWFSQKSAEVERAGAEPSEREALESQLGNCRTPHFLGEPTPDRRALTQIPHQELPEGMCKEWTPIEAGIDMLVGQARAAVPQAPPDAEFDGRVEDFKECQAKIRRLTALHIADVQHYTERLIAQEQLLATKDAMIEGITERLHGVREQLVRAAAVPAPLHPLDELARAEYADGTYAAVPAPGRETPYPTVTKEQGLAYVQAWGMEKTGENVAFYMNAIEFLVAKFAPTFLSIGNGIAAVQTMMRRADSGATPKEG